MKTKKTDINVIKPANQLSLFGYNNYFDLWIRLQNNRKLPNCILLTGPKGLGKATFVYHFVNSILSKGESNEYSIKNHEINKNNFSYKRIITNTHPNFFTIDNDIFNEQIKIEQVRNLLKFLSKSTFLRDLKIVLIDNFEKFNLNSINALLKAIEEPSYNTFFFIIHDNSYKISETIKSRCLEFKINFSKSQKMHIFSQITQPYEEECKSIDVQNNLYFDTPGNLLKKCLFLNKSKTKIKENSLNYAYFFLDQYLYEKNPLSLTFASFFIEKFYTELCFNNVTNLSIRFQNYSKILRQISDMKNFNLFEKNTLISIKDILHHETR